MRTKTLLGLVLLLAVLTYLFVPAALKLHKLKHQNNRLETEIQMLSARNQTLQSELRLLREDPVYIEYVARKTFNRAKDGEVIYRLVSADEPSS